MLTIVASPEAIAGAITSKHPGVAVSAAARLGTAINATIIVSK
jgi:hypothetical protein